MDRSTENIGSLSRRLQARTSFYSAGVITPMLNLKIRTESERQTLPSPGGTVIESTVVVSPPYPESVAMGM